MIRLIHRSEMLASASLAHHARGMAIVVALWGTVSACGSPQSGGEPSPALDATPVAPVEVVPVEPEYVPTAEELAAAAAAEANSAWERAATLIAESQPGERAYAEIVSLMEQVGVVLTGRVRHVILQLHVFPQLAAVVESPGASSFR